MFFQLHMQHKLQVGTSLDANVRYGVLEGCSMYKFSSCVHNGTGHVFALLDGWDISDLCRPNQLHTHTHTTTHIPKQCCTYRSLRWNMLLQVVVPCMCDYMPWVAYACVRVWACNMQCGVLAVLW